MYMNESTFVAFVPIIVHRGQPVVSESCLSRQTRLDYRKTEKGHSYLPDLDVPLVIDLAVPFLFTYPLIHILASKRSGMNPDHDQKGFCLSYRIHVQLTSHFRPVLVETWAERHLPFRLNL
jgi:hypothetical protein